jgi:O-acetyl-ADP-ribose deacetylase (regulator of RNase III)
MKQITGNIVTLANSGLFDVVCHGCNCFNAMGAGLAKTVRDNWPEAYYADLKTVRGDKKKLGSYSMAGIRRDGNEFIVVNAYTQYRYGANVVNADYDAIRDVFRAIKRDFSGTRIAYPLIGAGLAKGDWGIISGIIETELAGEDHTLVIYG